MQNWKEIMEALRTGSIPSKSELNLMNEQRQERLRGESVPKFKYVWKKKSRIFIAMQLAIPFNPSTGAPDEDYNPNSKWRPPISASVAAKIIKNYCLQNEEAHKVFMNRGGVSDWDVSDPDTLNEKDFEVLRKFRVPLTLTVDTISLKDKTITGQTFPVKYSIEVEYDYDKGIVKGDLPLIAKIGNFMSSVIFNEIRELDDAIKQKNPALYQGGNPEIAPNAIPEADEKQKKKWNGHIFNRAIISSPQPSNFYIGYEYPITTSLTMVDKGNPLPDYLSLNEEDFKKHMVYFDGSKKYRDYIDAVREDPNRDHFWDLIEFDLIDDCSSEPKTDDEKARASGDLKPAAPQHSFYDIDRNTVRFPWVQTFLDAFATYRNSDPEFEKKMAIFLAQRIKAADSTLTGAVIEAIAERVPLNNRYIKKETLSMHKEIMTLIYGDEYLQLVMEDPSGIQEAVEAKKEEISGAAEIMKEIAAESEPEVTSLDLE